MNGCLATDRPGCNVRMNGLHALIQALTASTEVVDVVSFSRSAWSAGSTVESAFELS